MTATTLHWEFRPLAASDRPLFSEWLARAHVSEWWGTSDPAEEFAESYTASITQTVPHWCYIAELNGEPTGFIQSYTPAAFHDEGWWLDEHDPTVRGIDQFLGNAEQLGQGIGTSMVRAFVAKLFADDASVTRIHTDPDPRNARAIRCYEKAGFRAIRELDTPDGVSLLMYCDRAGAGAGSGSES